MNEVQIHCQKPQIKPFVIITSSIYVYSYGRKHIITIHIERTLLPCHANATR